MFFTLIHGYNKYFSSKDFGNDLLLSFALFSQSLSKGKSRPSKKIRECWGRKSISMTRMQLRKSSLRTLRQLLMVPGNDARSRARSTSARIRVATESSRQSTVFAAIASGSARSSGHSGVPTATTRGPTPSTYTNTAVTSTRAVSQRGFTVRTGSGQTLCRASFVSRMLCLIRKKSRSIVLPYYFFFLYFSGLFEFCIRFVL